MMPTIIEKTTANTSPSLDAAKLCLTGGLAIAFYSQSIVATAYLVTGGMWLAYNTLQLNGIVNWRSPLLTAEQATTYPGLMFALLGNRKALTMLAISAMVTSILLYAQLINILTTVAVIAGVALVCGGLMELAIQGVAQLARSAGYELTNSPNTMFAATAAVAAATGLGAWYNAGIIAAATAACPASLCAATASLNAFVIATTGLGLLPVVGLCVVSARFVLDVAAEYAKPAISAASASQKTTSELEVDELAGGAAPVPEGASLR
jgi:hypothetical protein